MSYEQSTTDDAVRYTQVAFYVLEQSAEEKREGEGDQIDEEIINEKLQEVSVEFELDENKLRASIMSVYSGDLSLYETTSGVDVDAVKEKLEEYIEQKETDET